MPKRESASASTENRHQRRELGQDPIQMQEIESASASTENGHQCTEFVIDFTDLEPGDRLKCCIYKVPKNLRKLKEEAYTLLISIGPLHHDNLELAEMEEQKSRYLKAFVDETKINMEVFVMFVTKNETFIRSCYSRPSKFSSDQYVNMILLDAFFIIELFGRHHGKRDPDNWILKKLWLKNGIHDDLILLENQLPYVLLVRLYQMVFPKNDQPNFHQLTFTYFLKYNPEKLIINDQTEVCHFTDLLRYFMSRKLEPKSSGTSESIQSATKLHEAGVEFKGMEKASLSDIKFNKPVSCFCLGKPVLKLLQFEVNETTESFFRNLMAGKQCHFPDETYICSYIC